MDATHNISDASLYTDFSGLQKLRTKASGNAGAAESREATTEVARQFESLFLQMMMKSMRDATAASSTESDQTRFYQEMFDKQIALDLADGSNGGGLGIAALLQRDLAGSGQAGTSKAETGQQGAVNSIELIRQQLNRPSSIMPSAHNNDRGGDLEKYPGVIQE